MFNHPKPQLFHLQKRANDTSFQIHCEGNSHNCTISRLQRWLDTELKPKSKFAASVLSRTRLKWWPS